MNKNTQQFLSEFVDGGPGCGRDDCDVYQYGEKEGSRIVRCKSCGKTWDQPFHIPLGKKEKL